MTPCCVCRRSRTPFKVLTLSKDEKQAFRNVGKEAPDTLTYCQACWGISSHRVQGPQLFKGLLQLRFQSNGLSREQAEKVASSIEAELVKKASKSPLS